MKSTKQAYDNTNRSKKAEETRLAIMKALAQLWADYPINEITLEMIAGEAGVTTRTILRKFGSKEGLLEASLAKDPAEIDSARKQARVGDVDHILETLLSNYEKIGDAALRTIYLEPELEIARRIGEKGRKVHREWCERVFSPFLPEPDNPTYEIQLNSFIAVTEIYLWKLLRKDFQLSYKKTFSIFKNMIVSLIHNHSKANKS